MLTSELRDKIEELASRIRSSRYLVAFTGAGISTESGIPDFRGAPRHLETLPPHRAVGVSGRPGGTQGVLAAQNRGLPADAGRGAQRGPPGPGPTLSGRAAAGGHNTEYRF